MWPLTKSAVVEAESVVDDSFLKNTEQRLLEVESEREQVEEAFNESFRALAAHDEFRKRLAGEQSRITTRRSQLLQERAALLRTLGRIK